MEPGLDDAILSGRQYGVSTRFHFFIPTLTVWLSICPLTVHPLTVCPVCLVVFTTP